MNLAAANPDRQVVFFAIGFETTAPPNAMAVWLARKRKLTNFSVLVSHVLVPPMMTAILQAPGNRVQGFLGPGHVCTVMGTREYEPIARRYRRADRRSPASSRSTCSKASCGRCGSSRRAGPRSRTRTPAPSGPRATRRRGG